jgi:murein L,D-transpeptidase YafK
MVIFVVMNVRPGLIFILLFTCTTHVLGQSGDGAFRSEQLSSSRVADALKKYDDTLARDFKKKNIAYPPMDIYLRAFKSQNELELWARSSASAEYKLIKTYHICAVSGQLGPKRMRGDRQVPEGYYFIDEFNNHSDYYLSLLLSYPNYTDQVQGKEQLGGDIYLHGGCVTIGCLPMTNEGIKEIYAVCLRARLGGQENIPVHIFPTRLSKSGMAYLSKEYAREPAKVQFWEELRPGYEYFEKYHKLMPVMYSPEGHYVN